MGAFEFDKCCFCINLKTGCFIIAYFSLVATIVLAIMSILGLTAGSLVTAVSDEKEDQEAGITMLIISIMVLLFTILLLTFVIVLLVGLHKNKPGHVKAYLICDAVFIIITAVTFIISAASGGVSGKDIARNIFNILLSIYFFLVIRSQYLKMKNPERGPAIYNSA